MTLEEQVRVSISLQDLLTGSGSEEIVGATVGAGIAGIAGTTLGVITMDGVGIIAIITDGAGMTLGIVQIAGTDGIIMDGMEVDTTMHLLLQQLPLT